MYLFDGAIWAVGLFCKWKIKNPCLVPSPTFSGCLWIAAWKRCRLRCCPAPQVAHRNRFAAYIWVRSSSWGARIAQSCDSSSGLSISPLKPKRNWCLIPFVLFQFSVSSLVKKKPRAPWTTPPKEGISSSFWHFAPLSTPKILAIFLYKLLPPKCKKK